MNKELGLVDFSRDEFILKSPNPRQSDFKVVKKNTAINIHNLVRGLQPWPEAYFIREGKKIKILETRVSDKQTNAAAGEIVSIEGDSVFIATQNGVLELLKLKPEGKAAMTAKAWANGAGV